MLLIDVAKTLSLHAEGDQVAVTSTKFPDSVTLVPMLKFKLYQDHIYMISVEDGKLVFEATRSTLRKDPEAKNAFLEFLKSDRAKAIFL